MLVFLLIGERPPLRPPQHRCGDTSSRLAKRRNAVGSQTPTSVVLTAGTRTCRDDTTNCGPIVTMRGRRASHVALDRRKSLAGTGWYAVPWGRSRVPNPGLLRWVIVGARSATIRCEPTA